MKAIMQDRYGPPEEVLELRETDPPVATDGEVLVRVQAASLNAADWHFICGLPKVMRLMTGVRRPKQSIPGFDLAGTVLAVGRNVTRFEPGDEVFGQGTGTFAEVARIPEDGLTTKPAGLTFEQAAAVPLAALTALQGLRDKTNLQAGQRVLINGASGGVGTFAVQIAKAFGAHVTGVCSTRNVEMIGDLGADQVIDYTREDFTRDGGPYDLLFDLTGNHPLSECRRVLTGSGVYLSCFGSVGGDWFGPLAPIARVALAAPFVSQKIVSFVEKVTREDLLCLSELIEAGKVTPVIDRTFDLSETPAAVAYLLEGHTRGKTVITVSAAPG